MSPGNLYLGEPGCPEGSEGFVADLEFASVAQPITKDNEILRVPERDGQPNKRYHFRQDIVMASSKDPGAEITVRLRFRSLCISNQYLQGTALFMAGELLDKMLFPAEKSKNKIRPAEIERGVHHDLESFILVLFYAAMKRGLERGLWNPPAIQRIKQLFQVLFGGHTIREIAEGRKTFLEIPEYLLDNVDPPMERLLYGLWKLLKLQWAKNPQSTERAAVDGHFQWSSEGPTLMTYGQLYKVYGLAIARLSNSN